MNASEVLRIVDAIHRDKNIDKEIVFQAIESALVSASKKHHGEEADIIIHIDRESGAISGTVDGMLLDHEEAVGRIGAQTAKQVIIQKIREAERDSLYEEYEQMLGQMVSGIVQKNEGGATIVSLGNVEAILPRSEQIPGESHDVNERVRATVFDVRKQGSRVKVILSRARPQLVQRLFEQEIPEIAEGVITIEALSREPGYRSKVAVVSSDQRVDCVGACVGVRGNRIKNIVDELANERIDIVRYSDDMQVLIPNSLQPAEVDEVILCKMMGRAIVLVREDQLSLAIGRRGQNVRLGSKLCKWDIEIMTQDELQDQIERAVAGFSLLEGVTDELAERLVGEGFLSYDDLSVIEPSDLMEMGDLTEEQVDLIVEQAETKAEEAEKAAAEQRRLQREKDRLEKEIAAAEEAQQSSRPQAEPASEDVPAAEADSAAAEADSGEVAAEQTDGEAGTGAAPVDASEEKADEVAVPAAEADPAAAEAGPGEEAAEQKDGEADTDAAPVDTSEGQADEVAAAAEERPEAEPEEIKSTEDRTSATE
jgi:N utilization substance protein A